MKFEMNGRRLDLRAEAKLKKEKGRKRKRNKIVVKLFQDGRLLDKTLLVAGEIKKNCSCCGKKVFKRNSFSVRVNNYLPEDKAVLLKFSNHCSSCNVYNHFHSLFEMDIEKMIN